MSEEIDRLLELNQTFYTALSDANLNLMESVWLHNEKIKCVHPGWDLLNGWAEVRKSWLTIFSTGGPLEVKTSDITIQIIGTTAWLTCIEHITHKVSGQLRTGFAAATSIFEKQDDHWNMVHHHASPVPGRDFTDEILQ